MAAVTGPNVRLDDEGAQALSLAIHEFVTNSIKYGALSGKGDLAVGWRRARITVQRSSIWTSSAVLSSAR